MSSYENYARVSAVYNETRTAQGVEIVRRLLAKGDTALTEQTLVDAGCGTGQYSAALAGSVGRIEAVDLNPAMLAQARHKLQRQVDAGAIGLHQASIDDLPIPDGSVDAVMVNQVLHHLADDPAAAWPVHQRVFGEFARVLKPGGIVVINSCSHRQLEQGFWFYQLIPDAVDRVRQRTADLDTLVALLRQGNIFDKTQHEIPTDIILQGDAYFDAPRIFDSQWRGGDSIWALVTAPELEGALQEAQILSDRGELDDFMRRHDTPRGYTGQLSFTWSRKVY